MTVDRERRCSGMSATWCPVHGDCTCADKGSIQPEFDDPRCPLHAPESPHADGVDTAAFHEAEHRAAEGRASAWETVARQLAPLAWHRPKCRWLIRPGGGCTCGLDASLAAFRALDTPEADPA